MPINPNINMMYQGVKLPDHLANALSGQKLQAMQMENQAAQQQMDLQNSPEMQEQRKLSTARDTEGKKLEFLKSALPYVQDQPSYDAMKMKAVQLFGQEADDNFPMEFDPIITEKIKLNLGIIKPEAPQKTMSPIEEGLIRSKIERNRRLAQGGRGGQQPAGSIDGTTNGAAPQPAPNLPVPALKLEQEAKDNVNTAQMISRDMDRYMYQIESGQLDLGPIKNLANRGRNWAGMSTEQSGNLARLDAGLQKLRNDSLRLNKGPQTDGDADRAWQELIANINDPAVVKARMADIKALNENAARWHMQQANAVRQNFGAPPVYDFGNQPQQGVQTPAQTPQTGVQRQMSMQDQQAYQWAQMNPNDPRAQSIMDRLRGSR